MTPVTCPNERTELADTSLMEIGAVVLTLALIFIVAAFMDTPGSNTNPTAKPRVQNAPQTQTATNSEGYCSFCSRPILRGDRYRMLSTEWRVRCCESCCKRPR